MVPTLPLISITMYLCCLENLFSCSFILGLVCLTSTRDGMTALHRAVEGNQHKIIPLLLAADPKVANIQDRNGRSPLHLACDLNHKNCVISLFVSYPISIILASLYWSKIKLPLSFIELSWHHYQHYTP